MGKIRGRHGSGIAPAQTAFEFYRSLPIRPVRPERLFFALFPDPRTSIRIGQLRRRFLWETRLDGAPIKMERFHISLHHVGDYQRLRDKFVYAAKQAGNAVAVQPFEITFHSIKSFERARSINGGRAKWPLVLLGGSEVLFDLHGMLGEAMKKNGLRAAEHFVPHLTLLYGSKPIPIQAIEPIRFWVTEFKLIHSELGLTQYHEKGSWTLEV